jgi:hypothetical protein
VDGVLRRFAAMRLALRRVAAVAIIVAASASVLRAADPSRKAFVESWRGRRVEIKRTLFTLVFNERGKLGKVYHDKREGLVVVTPSSGACLQFDGRDGEPDIAATDVQQVVDRIGESYRRQQALDIGFYLRIEPLLVVRYEARGTLVVKDALVERSRVRVLFASLAPDVPPDEIATALTVQWPTDFSPAFTERPLVEGLIRQYVGEPAARATAASSSDLARD